MVKLVLATLLALSPLGAAEFTLTIGNPLAANVARMKTVGMAVRLEECADPAKAKLSGTAEGVEAGARKSLPVQIVAGSGPGVYAVNHNWPNDGAWVVSLRAECGSATAGAIVPFRGFAYVRDAIKIFPRFPAAAEIDRSLNELSGGAK
jgi:hypothetical protein